MFDLYLRSKYPKVLKFLGSVGSWSKLSANTFTAIGLVLGILSGFLIAVGFNYIGALALSLSMLCDLFDGAVARVKGPSRRGELLDSSSDRVVDSAVFCGLIYVSLSSKPINKVTLLMFLISYGATLVISYIRAKGDLISISNKLPLVRVAALFERGERLVFLEGVILLVPIREVLAIALAAGLLVTVIQRFYNVWKIL